LNGTADQYLIIETQGHDPLAEVKQQEVRRVLDTIAAVTDTAG
jgi:hypothetical protein